ncbi:glycoside hydrolase family 2 protein [Dysgonomonas macrotermitis]|uniref:Beta-galactosidase/beta-glucuronidase n=1 Tax=Dysgonomonas macrotermitis TaxID=1346286 RepID=A0A1M4VUM3_9BACT|nr:glycoside hydrolase family 2 TIM barrel-domain containing protein [Dysgonomonas macrotermitis]SHE72523.1 Beta-galactosidase/beta-glucuronidase [Dysgonomonas macrotermitis]
MRKHIVLILICLVTAGWLPAQNRYELNSGWKCHPLSQTKDRGENISNPSYSISKWKNAVVPGTVLTSLLANKEIPDPFYGMNNEKIPDIYDTGRDYYTYWFVKDFQENTPVNGEQIWLTFRGINYSCEIYLNGQKVNKEKYEGMFLRKTFNITGLLSKNGKNRLAVIVYPPDPVGKPNGGQGGDGRIAKNVSHQYVAGWDWIQPIRDRNTGIWDKVYIEKTGLVNLKNPHVITLVPGKRIPGDKQDEAVLKVSAELQNAGNAKISGTLKYEINGDIVTQKVSVDANSEIEVSMPDYTIKNPKLWWPSGYGNQDLYKIKIEFVDESNQKTQDFEIVQFGVREIQTEWNSHTRSKEIYVNGQRIFIKGGNWIISDAMLRFSNERYDAEIRYHRDMNLNLIRIWGGALTERPEFYEACNKYGMLVIQDFWFSGDCNGRWLDPLKAEDQWTRRKYPDNHGLVLESAIDMIKMIRNHASLAMWCGGNEIKPPVDILLPLRDTILPKLDGTRWFIDYSNSDEWSYNFLGGNGDGPYTIQPIESFWEKQTWPFNSEVGSVGVGDYESLLRFIPKENLIAPRYNPDAKFKEDVDPVWTYHTYSGVGYENHILPYGEPTDIKDFAMKAQLVNYNQYRALIEGFSSHMWEWYTGTIIWKTQNPWTSMRGQMYDYYLDPNACLFGLRKGSEMIHIMCNPVTKQTMVVNNSFEPLNDMMLVAKHYDYAGNETLLTQEVLYMEASHSKKIIPLQKQLEEKLKEDGGFLYLQLLDRNQKLVSDNFYWYPNAKGEYTGLNKMNKTEIKVTSRIAASGKMEISITNAEKGPVAFFNRIAIVDSKTGERILPAFYSDNYISVVPGETKNITVEYTPQPDVTPKVVVLGWNTEK